MLDTHPNKQRQRLCSSRCRLILEGANLLRVPATTAGGDTRATESHAAATVADACPPGSLPQRMPSAPGCRLASLVLRSAALLRPALPPVTAATSRQTAAPDDSPPGVWWPGGVHMSCAGNLGGTPLAPGSRLAVGAASPCPAAWGAAADDLPPGLRSHGRATLLRRAPTAPTAASLTRSRSDDDFPPGLRPPATSVCTGVSDEPEFPPGVLWPDDAADSDSDDDGDDGPEFPPGISWLLAG